MSDPRPTPALLAERRARMIRLFARAPMKATTGMELSYDEEGRAAFDRPYAPSFDHALGAIHGGLFATLLDNAGWFTVAPHYATWIVTVELQTRLLEPIAGEALRAIGRAVRVGRTVAVAEMEVRTASGLLAAVGSGTFVPTRTPISVD